MFECVSGPGLKTVSSVKFNPLLLWRNFVDLSHWCHLIRDKDLLETRVQACTTNEGSIFAVFYGVQWRDSGYETDPWQLPEGVYSNGILTNSKKKTLQRISTRPILRVVEVMPGSHCTQEEVEMTCYCCSSIKTELGWISCMGFRLKEKRGGWGLAAV